ncbi:MAG: alkaline phosphatase family protein [Bacteroidales bacterium]|nr:alkaline phosphatase family protein [Bacteroidales bacterium]
MLKIKLILLSSFFLLLFTSCTKEKNPYLIMLSMDGFRWDYASMTETPNFDRLTATGVHAASMKPSYPSKTFPNHFTMVTGLYPDHHGIVQNNFYDPSLDREFRIKDRDAVEDSIFWGGEAIWETAEKQGVHSASYFWVGSETNEHYRPGIRKFYEQNFPFEQRIDSVISWLHMPEAVRPHLILFYFHEPDGVGHKFGPDSEETRATIRDLDHLLGTLMTELEQTENELDIKVYLIITSDHGMGAIPAGQYVFLDKVVDIDRMQRVNGGNPVYLLEPEKDYLDEAYKLLSQTPHIRVWRKNELPESYHYGTNPRVPELVVEADRGWGISFSGKKNYSLGTHGYDPCVPKE